MKFSEKYIENQKLRSKPISHFESLAKDGFLNQYIEEFLPEKYRNDLSFREEIMKLQVKYSDVPVAEISKEYLKELSKSLSYFDNLVNT
ncbi:MAG: hypothetical protein ACE364_03410 [Chlorobiota bacterium]